MTEILIFFIYRYVLVRQFSLQFRLKTAFDYQRIIFAICHIIYIMLSNRCKKTNPSSSMHSEVTRTRRCAEAVYRYLRDKESDFYYPYHTYKHFQDTLLLL